jgi:flavin-binding protein dodecin
MAGGTSWAPRNASTPPFQEGGSMSVAKVSEISATSTKSFEDAINSGLARAHQTIRNIRSAWIKEQQVRLEQGKIVEYQVNMLITFVLDE